MKGILFYFVLLFLEAQGSFFDDFRGAISNINQGFGKVLSDVVTDVKDTIYCTISDVEQVLGLNGFLDKRARYNQRCKGRKSPKHPSLNSQDSSHSRTVSEIQKNSVIHEKHISRSIIHESEHSIKTVNKTIINVSGHINLKNETDRLSEISKMRIQESEYRNKTLSKKLQKEIEQLQLNNNKKAPADSNWEAVNFLNNSRRNSKNDTEINHIRQILEKVTNEMHLKINGQQTLDTHKLHDLKKEFRDLANNNGKLNSTVGSQELLNKTKQSNYTSMSFKDVNEVGRDETRQLEKSVQLEKSTLSLGLDSLVSFFNFMYASHDDLIHAKKIVTESQQSEKLLNKFFRRN